MLKICSMSRRNTTGRISCAASHMCYSYLYCSILQCVAVRCSVLQCVAVCCSVFYFLRLKPGAVHIHLAACCGLLQCGAVRSSAEQCGAVWCSVGVVWSSMLQCGLVCCSVLQCNAVLQRVVVCCYVQRLPMYVLVCCNVLHSVAACHNGAQDLSICNDN